MKDDKDLLRILMEDSEKQTDVYRPSAYWRRSEQVAAEKMLERGITNFRSPSSGIIGQGYTDAPILDPALLWERGGITSKLRKWIANKAMVRRYFLRPYLALIEALHTERGLYQDYYLRSKLGSWFEEYMQRHGLPDTLVGQCATTLNLEGAEISKHYLGALAKIHNLSSRVDFTKITRVFEIGGGFGANAHLLMHMFPNIRKYLYLDIPPMLYVGTQYLKHFFPAQVRDYRETRDQSALTFCVGPTCEIIAIAPWQIENVKASVDVFINFASMQEMSEDIVRNYAGKIKTLMQREGKLCLLMYPMDRPDGVRLTNDEILRFFEDSFHVETITPEVTTEIINPPHYFLLER